MARYEFRNAVDGRVTEIVAPMSVAPVEDIVIGVDGEWRYATRDDPKDQVWERIVSVPSGVVVKDAGGVRYDGVPYSRTMPSYHESVGTEVVRNGVRVREVAKDTYATADGRPICDTAGAIRRHCDMLGCSHFKD